MTDVDTLIRAAELLEQLASDLRESNTVAGEWAEDTDQERADYEEQIEIADRLRRMAE